MAKAKVKKDKKDKKPRQKKQVSGDNFLVLHGEKFLFAFFVCLAIWLIAQGSGLPHFELTPEQIKDATTKADNHIKQNKVEPTDIDKDLNVYNYLDYASLIKSSLKADPYETSNRWEQSLFPEKILRPTIRPLPVENLRAVASVGAIRYKKTTAVGDDSYEDRGKHWITVTGLIPVANQLKEYNDMLGRSQYTDPDRDVPKYLLYDIYRGTVDEKGNTVWDARPIDLERVYETEVDQWIRHGLDPVALDYTVPLFSPDSPSLTMECPPLVNKSFGAEVTNLPNIPLLSETQKEELAEQMAEMQNQETETKRGQRRDFSTVLNNPFASQSGGGTTTAPRAGFGAMPGMNPMAGPMGMAGSRMPGSTTKVTKVVNYYLFRFFDFGAEEGHTYQYKVVLYLANPNYGLDVNLVEDGNAVLKPTIVSAESKPSNLVSLGSESRILAESIEASGLTQEPKITISSIYFRTDNAKESLVGGKRMVRGQIANFPRQAHKPLDLGSSMTYSTTTDIGRRTDRLFDDHESNICILDADGGERIAGTEFRAPAKMLVMEPNGLLTLHNETEDQAELLPYQIAAGGGRR